MQRGNQNREKDLQILPKGIRTNRKTYRSVSLVVILLSSITYAWGVAEIISAEKKTSKNLEISLKPGVQQWGVFGTDEKSSCLANFETQLRNEDSNPILTANGEISFTLANEVQTATLNLESKFSSLRHMEEIRMNIVSDENYFKLSSVTANTNDFEATLKIDSIKEKFTFGLSGVTTLKESSDEQYTLRLPPDFNLLSNLNTDLSEFSGLKFKELTEVNTANCDQIKPIKILSKENINTQKAIKIIKKFLNQ